MLSDEHIRGILRRVDEPGIALSMVLMDAMPEAPKQLVHRNACDKYAIAGEQLASEHFLLAMIALIAAVGWWADEKVVVAAAASLFRAIKLADEQPYREGLSEEASDALFLGLIDAGNIGVLLRMRAAAHEAGLVPRPVRCTTMWYRALEADPPSAQALEQFMAFDWKAEPHEATYLLARERSSDTYRRGTPQEVAVYTRAMLYLSTTHEPRTLAAAPILGL